MNVNKKDLVTTLALALSLLVVGLAGCTSSDSGVILSGDTVTLQIPVSPTELFEVEIPKELSTFKETDNNLYWKLSDDTTIYRMSELSTLTTEYDEDTGLYVAPKTVIKEFGDGCIIVATSKELQPTFVECMSKGTVREVNTYLDYSNELEELPSYTVKEMEMTESNMYMPVGAREADSGYYTCSILSNGDTWLESWILDGSLKDIQNKLVTICLGNSGQTSLSSWYKTDDIIYLTAGDNVLAAKRLQYNEWYVYFGSVEYTDYILTGIEKVRRAN